MEAAATFTVQQVAATAFFLYMGMSFCHAHYHPRFTDPVWPNCSAVCHRHGWQDLLKRENQTIRPRSASLEKKTTK
jgi:hypothetical protein